MPKKQNSHILSVITCKSLHINEWEVKKSIDILTPTMGRWLSLRKQMSLGFLAFYGDYGDILTVHECKNTDVKEREYKLVFSSAYYEGIDEYRSFYKEWEEMDNERHKALIEAEKILAGKNNTGEQQDGK